MSNETITGHLDGDNVSFTATRPDDFVYSLANAPLDNTTVTLATSTPVVPWALEFKVGATTPTHRRTTRTTASTSAAMGGGADAAHSCIGMPIS